MNERVLIVEDDPSVRETATLLLQRVGLEVTAVGDGKGRLDALAHDHFDLVVLDVMLPSADGFEICREVRRTSPVPIVMLTARDEISDVVAGLELGADDYITKPFGEASPQCRSPTWMTGARPFRVTHDGAPVEGPVLVARVLVEFARRPGCVLSRGTLLDLVWGYDYLGDSRLVDMAVKRLRDKLGDDCNRPRYIATVRGAGYRFDGD